jgi:phosphoserine phosphatase RsbU/P
MLGPSMPRVTVEEDLAAIAKISAVPTILRTIREATGLRFTLVARVLPDRWVACAVHDEIAFGLLPGGELDVTTTLCAEVRDSLEPILIEHASEDPAYSAHLTPKMYGFQSYVAVPIYRKTGEYFGNVCGLDPEPRKLKDGKTLATLQLFAELISRQLEAEVKHAEDRATLEAERADSQLREQFIAVLGHDVRNPLSSIAMGTELLLAKSGQGPERRTLERIRASSKRISSLVDDLMDLARGRLGSGVPLQLAPAPDLALRLHHVVAEMQSAHPERQIGLQGALSRPVLVDEQRIEQLLSNLLANAVQHGSGATAIKVELDADDSELRLRVENEGETIPEELRRRLFEPYVRGDSQRREGLGLGLYIVSEIARAHGGGVSVTSEGGRTAFLVTLPQLSPSG